MVVVRPAMVRVVGVVEGFEEPRRWKMTILEYQEENKRKFPEEEKPGCRQERETKYEDERPHGCSITGAFPSLSPLYISR